MSNRFYIQRRTGNAWHRFSPQRGYHENVAVDELLTIAEPGLYRARYVTDRGRLAHYGEPIEIEGPENDDQPTISDEPPTAESQAAAAAAAPAVIQTDPTGMPFPMPTDHDLLQFMWTYRIIRDDIKSDTKEFLQLMSQQMNVALLAEQTRARESLELSSQHYKAVAKLQQAQVDEMRKRTEDSEDKAEIANTALVQVMQQNEDDAAVQPADAKQALIEQLPMLLQAAKEFGILPQ